MGLAYNQLSGTIPVEIGSLANLWSIRLGYNHLTGTVPAELGNLANLEDLRLDNNQLSGTIPPELGHLSKLKTLYLQGNRLTGALPHTFTQLTSLEVFAFSNGDAGLCAPPNEAFQDWLQGISNQNLAAGVTPLGPNCTSSSATPTATATAIPTPVAGSCTEAITPPATINGTWASDCLSEKPSRATGGGQRYARFYTFTLTQASDVEITMESSADTYLYLLAGHGTDGTTLHDNDDHDSNEFSLAANTDSGISATLDAGDYTIEATTYASETTGDFTLTVTVGGATAPSPSPSPSPTPPAPPDYDIEEHACDADDLTNIGTFTLDSEFGPETYAANYDGVRAYYRATWDDAQTGLRVVCMANQYDGVQNARWDGLNYSSVLQGFGALENLEVLAHGQAFVSPRVGDDMLALHAEYRFDNDLTRLSEVRFIDAATNTVSLVRFIVSNGSGYPDIDDVASVARLIADRVSRDNSQSQGAQRAGLLSEAFALPGLR